VSVGLGTLMYNVWLEEATAAGCTGKSRGKRLDCAAIPSLENSLATTGG